MQRPNSEDVEVFTPQRDILDGRGNCEAVQHCAAGQVDRHQFSAG